MGAGNPQNTSPSKNSGDESPSTQSKKKAGKKGNSGSSKKMTAKEQSERFVKVAKDLQADESEKSFDSIFEKVANFKRQDS